MFTKYEPKKALEQSIASGNTVRSAPMDISSSSIYYHEFTITGTCTGSVWLEYIPLNPGLSNSPAIADSTVSFTNSSSICIESNGGGGGHVVAVVKVDTGSASVKVYCASKGGR